MAEKESRYKLTITATGADAISKVAELTNALAVSVQGLAGKITTQVQLSNQAAGANSALAASFVVTGDKIQGAIGAYNSATSSLNLYSAAADHLEEIVKANKSAGITTAQAKEAESGFNLLEMAVGHYDEKLDELKAKYPGIAAAAGAIDVAKEKLRALAKATDEAASSQANLASKIDANNSLYSRSVAGIEKYTDIQAELAKLGGQQLASNSGRTAATNPDLAVTRDAYNLASEAIKGLQASIDSLTPEQRLLAETARTLAAEHQKVAAATNAASAAQKTYDAQVEEASRAYNRSTDQLKTYSRVISDLEKTAGAQRLSGGPASQNPELQKTLAALDLARNASGAYQAQIDKLTPAEQRLAQQLRATTQAIKDEEAALKNLKPPLDDVETHTSKTVKAIEGLGRGLASSVIGFSLIAGGTVALGHILGQFFTEAEAKSEKFRKDIEDISILNPSINTDQLFDQLKDMATRVGIVSDKLAALYKLSAPAVGGNTDQAGQLTEQLAAGAQGARQDPTAWAKASIATMQAYGLTISDVTRVQDILTIAMQNSAGAGDKVIEQWGSVTKAAAGAGTSLEDNAAIIELIAKHGGDLEENMRALKGAYDAINTQRAQDEFRALGISMQNADGTAASMVDIVRQLHDRLSGLGTAAQNVEIGRVFQDRDVRNVVRTMVTAFDELGAAKENALQPGASSKAFAEYLDSSVGRVAKYKAGLDAWVIGVGDALNVEKHAAEALSDLDTKLQASKEYGGDQVKLTWTGLQVSDEGMDRMAAALQKLKDEFNAAGGSAAALKAEFGEDIVHPETVDGVDRLAAALKKQTAELVDAKLKRDDPAKWAEITNAINLQTTAYKALAEAIGFAASIASPKGSVYTQESHDTNFAQNAQDDLDRINQALQQNAVEYANWGGKVLDASYLASTSVDGLSTSVNSLITEFTHLSGSGEFEGFASKAEMTASHLSTTLNAVNLEIVRLQAAPVNKENAEALAAKIAEGKALVAQLTAVAAQVVAESPKAAQAQEKWDQFVEGKNAADKLNAAQKDLSDTTALYTAKVKALSREQQDLQNILRDEAIPQATDKVLGLSAATETLINSDSKLKEAVNGIAAAHKALDDATKNLKDTTDHYTASVAKLQTELARVKAIGESALTPLQDSVTDAQNKLDNFNTGATRVMNALNDTLFDLNDKLTQAKNTSAVILQPFIDAAKQADDNLKQLNKDLKETDDNFDKMRAPIEAANAALKAMADSPAMQKLKSDIQDLNDKLYELNKAEQDALTPLEDTLYSQAEALTATKDAAASLAATYANLLNPLQKEYNALQREANQQQEQEKLHNERLSVENIRAQLAGATAGSSDAIRLAEMLAKAQNTQTRDTRMFDLKNQIDDITAARDADMEAANAVVAAAQKEYDQTNRQIELTKRKYELEKRQITDDLRDKQRQLDMNNRWIDEQVAANNKILAGIDAQQAEYDKLQKAKIADATTSAETAHQNLSDQQAIRTAVEQTWQVQITAQEDLIKHTAHTQDVVRRGFADTLTDATDFYNQQKGLWDGVFAEQEKAIATEKAHAKTDEDAAKVALDNAKTSYDDIKKKIGEVINTVGDYINKTNDTATTTEDAKKKIVISLQEQQDAIKKVWEWQNALNDAIKNGAVVKPGELPPGVTLPPGYTPPAHRPGEPAPPPPPPPPPGSGKGGRSSESGDLTQTIVSSGFTPVPVSTYTAKQPVTVAGLTVAFSISATGTDMKSEQYWRDMGILAVKGIDSALTTQYGLKLSKEQA